MNENWKDFLKEKRREIIFLVSAGIVVLASVALIGFVYKGGKSYVPDEYVQTRTEATKISREIVILGNEVNKSLMEISNKTNIGDYSSALSVARSGTSQINQIGSKAQELLGALGGMAKNVEGVKPTNAAKVGKDAISVGIKMVERLIVYSKLSNDLVKKIEDKLVGGNINDSDIQKTINDINNEVKFINSLNNDYGVLIKQFDDLTRDTQ
jgi:hypothetical protein